jgi:hypothetical protein
MKDKTVKESRRIFGRAGVTAAAFLLFIISAVPGICEEEVNYVPMAGWEYIAFGSQAVSCPGLGAVVSGEYSTFSGIYKNACLTENPPLTDSSRIHSIDIMLGARMGRHQVVSSFISESDQPVTGGWATFQSALIYIFQLIKNETLVISLGAGAALGDFGIDLKNGNNWPLLPIPYISFEYSSSILDARFMFVSGPCINITVFPENRFRISGEVKIDNVMELKDVGFNTAVHYRLFTEDDLYGDFAEISAGLKSDSFEFTPGGGSAKYAYKYYSLFSEIDLSIFKISGGFSFNGREQMGKLLLSEPDNGKFLSIVGMYKF